MYRFRAHIGVLMNITPDHLDRYDHCFQNYVDAKMRITQNMTSRDWFVYSGDDEVIWQQLPKYDLRMKQLPFAAKNAVASGAGDAFLCDGKFTATAGRHTVEIDTAKLQHQGAPQRLQRHGRGAGRPRRRGRRGADSHVALRLRARRAPPGTRVAERGGRSVDQRLEGHERRFGLLRAGEHDTPGGVDRRRHGQGQRLHAAQGVRPPQRSTRSSAWAWTTRSSCANSRAWCPR